MHNFQKICLALACAGRVLQVVSGRADPTDDTSFLDQPLPPAAIATVKLVPIPDPNKPSVQINSPMISVSSFARAVELLGKISGKKTTVDTGLGTWPGEATEDVSGVSMGFSKSEKARTAFEQICMFAGLTWKYDAAHDTILLTPEWKRDDPRDEKEIVQVIEQIQPVRSDKLPTSFSPNRVGGHGPELDAWRIAFDALLSKPVNYSSAGTLRVYHDSHGHAYFFPSAVQNVFSGLIQDGQGGQALLVLNEQQSITNKDSAGDLAYYLFDERGLFLRGGVYAVADGAESGITGVELKNKQITVDVGYGSFKLRPDHLHLGLVNSDLILLGSTDSKGKERNAEETRQSLCEFSRMMQLKFTVIGKQNTQLPAPAKI